MKISKRILILSTFLLICGIISAGISLGLMQFFNYDFWYSFVFFTILQIIAPFIRDFIVDTLIIKRAADEYRAKPYKKYNIPLNCSYCGKSTNVDIELTDTTYKCNLCDRKNALYVNFMVAAITNDDV